MKVRLLQPERDAAFEPRLPPKMTMMIEDDLELRTLYEAMAAGDEFLREVVAKVVPASLRDPAVIEYRQHVLADCMANPETVRQMYAIAADAVEVRRKVFLGGMLFRDPEAILRRSVRILELLVANLKQLRAVCDRHTADFTSAGFRQLLAMIAEQLSDDYLAHLDDELAELHLPRGVLLSARLGLGNKGRRHVLHRAAKLSWWERLTGNSHNGFGFTIDERDQAGAEALTELAGRAINDVANTVTQSADHVLGFFVRLRMELAFYLGCLNLHARLTESGVGICFPTPTPIGAHRLSCRELRDVGLCLTTTRRVIGNDVSAESTSLIVVTGANEGGKSTFLRSVGAAQMMMQAGMFVTAQSFLADVSDGIFTHFKREEDATLTHGKLDEELARMSQIAGRIGSKALLLCNESFASTNEREGAQIARGIVDALTEKGIKVVYVTHLYHLAHSLHARHNSDYLFLRAERCDEGVRTFRLIPAEPHPTSYGDDSFRRVFGLPAGAEATAATPS
jgi:MutS domain V